MKKETMPMMVADEKRVLCLSWIVRYFEVQKKPITVNEFKDMYIEQYRSFYSPHMIGLLFQRMLEKGMLMEVYRKNGSSIPRLYIPYQENCIPFPHEEREWESKQEREERKQKAYRSSVLTLEEDYQFFLYMIGSPHAERKSASKRPLRYCMKRNDKEFKRFISLITPYLSLLDEKYRKVLTAYLGIEGRERQTMKAIAEDSGLTQGYVSNLYRASLFRIDRLMREKLAMSASQPLRFGER